MPTPSTRLALHAVILLLASCGVPERLALPVAVPLTQGGTTVPAQGVGGGLEFGDGFLGQELMRTELLSVGLFGGVGDRVSVAVNTFSETRSNGMDGSYLRAKARVGPVLGPNSSLAVAFAYSSSARDVQPVQDERATTVDLATPIEFVLTRSDTARRSEVSAYLAPRLILEKYTDELDRTQTLSAGIWGALAGLHVRGGNVHLFGELNLLRLPSRTVRGTAFDGGVVVIPALGIAFHFGRAHRWGRIGD